MTVDQSLAGMGPDSLAGKVALVTGAGSGHGRAVTQHLLALGAAVLAVDIDEVGLRGTLDHATHPDSLLVECIDVTEDAAMGAAVEHAVAELGRLTTVVHCPPVAPSDRLLDLGTDEFQSTLARSVGGLFAAARYAVPAMLHEGDGSIVAVCDEGGAMQWLAARLAAAYAGRGLRSNCISLTTDATGDPESLVEVAHAAAFLASDQSRLVTGSVIAVGPHG